MTSRIILGFASLLLGGAIFAESVLTDRMTFSTLSDSMDVTASEKVLQEAYKTLGIEISVETLPAAEALRRANEGEVDGEVQRIDGITKQYSHLIQIPIPINYIQGAVFSKRTDLKILGWHSLKPFRIGLVKGVLFAEKGTSGMNTVTTSDYRSLVDLVINDEVDVIVAPYINGLVAIKNHPQGAQLHTNGILETYLLYHYLNEEHQDLVPIVTKVLKGLLLDGTIPRIRKEALRELVGETEP
ncbi:MAG: transporter substrate-binding domain-containing protein [Candidatus Omnitrophica bacterium]|nr:transporter substrate-binding domain-containing protein [Candidatus Omnitrophota bacterium]